MVFVNKTVFMKKFILSLLTLLCGLSLLSGQDFHPTTTWPYIYGDFIDGTVKLSQGIDKKARLNVSLASSRLHYIDGELVKEMNMSDVLAAGIGNDIYQNISGKMMKVIAKSEKSLVVEGAEVDYATLNSTGAAYGTSSNTLGTMALTSAEGIGTSSSSKNVNHVELKNSKEDGKMLPLIVKRYIFVKGYKIYCTKKDIGSLNVDQAAVKAFMKENKIKLKDPQDALMLGDFLSGLL